MAVTTSHPPSSSSSETPSANTQQQKQKQHQQHAHQQPQTQQQRLHKSWRSYASYIVQAKRSSEKAIKQHDKASMKELDETVVTTLRARAEFLRLLNAIEGKLLGQEEERQALESSMRSQPSLGIQRRGKRKRNEEPVMKVAANTSAPLSTATNTSTTTTSTTGTQNIP